MEPFVAALPSDFNIDSQGYPSSAQGENPLPGESAAVLVLNLPEICGENSLRPIFESVGRILDLRLMNNLDEHGCGGAAALVVYGNVEHALKAIEKYDDYELVPGTKINVCMFTNEGGDVNDSSDQFEFGDVGGHFRVDFRRVMEPISSTLSQVFEYFSGNSEMDDRPIKVDKWDGSAVKNALDDAVKKVFTEKLKYVESHKLMDGRLGISGIAVGAAMFALLWDYLYPFPDSRPVLIICVVSYFILMGVLTLYTTFVEKGIFLEAVDKDRSGIDPDNIWRASSSLRRFDHMYHLVISYEDGSTKTSRDYSLEKSVSTWFDENGTLLYDTFEPEILNVHSSLLSEKKKN